MKLVIASHNEGKVREIGEMLRPLGFDVVSAGSLGLLEPEETETTFEGNAELKSRAACSASGFAALADDSGLVIPALGGAPGVYSARWAPNKDFTVAFARIQKELEAIGAPLDSLAHFICVLSLAMPDGEVKNVTGRVDGKLTFPARGEKGFGYDPIFIPEGYSETFAELEPKIKNALSHRARAFKGLVEFLKLKN